MRLVRPPSPPDVLPVPRLWIAFVCAWLPVFVFLAWLIVQQPLHAVRLAASLVGLLAFTALFVWLTLRAALAAGDLMPSAEHKVAVRRRLLTLAVMTGLVLVLVGLVPELGMWWLIMHVIVAAGLSLPVRLAAPACALLVGLAIGLAWLVTGEFDAELLTQVAFAAGAIAVRQLTLSVEQLRLAREELAGLAVAEERLRFARDLHDLIGHSLSTIVLKSELATRLLPTTPERTAAELHDIEVTARDALRQVREAVAGYRQPTLRGELAAAREVLAAAGIALRIDASADGLPGQVDTLLAWAVREGVTNAIRHSRAPTCRISVRVESDVAWLEVSDDGRGGQSAGLDGHAAQRGHGLAGLAERAAAHDGCLRAGPLATGGFQLTMTVPLETARA
jgi:two-component system sensor histidine kinase DesK